MSVNRYLLFFVVPSHVALMMNCSDHSSSPCRGYQTKSSAPVQCKCSRATDERLRRIEGQRKIYHQRLAPLRPLKMVDIFHMQSATFTFHRHQISRPGSMPVCNAINFRRSNEVTAREYWQILK